MSLNVIPREGLDVARFGEQREVLRARLGSYDSFRRTPDAPLTDCFAALGIFVDFNEADALNFIEVTSPADIVFDGVILLGRNHREVVSELDSRGVRGVEDQS